MARISGVDLPREKRVEIGLTYIYGIGKMCIRDRQLSSRMTRLPEEPVSLGRLQENFVRSSS